MFSPKIEKLGPGPNFRNLRLSENQDNFAVRRLPTFWPENRAKKFGKKITLNNEI